MPDNEPTVTGPGAPEQKKLSVIAWSLLLFWVVLNTVTALSLFLDRSIPAFIRGYYENANPLYFFATTVLAGFIVFSPVCLSPYGRRLLNPKYRLIITGLNFTCLLILSVPFWHLAAVLGKVEIVQAGKAALVMAAFVLLAITVYLRKAVLYYFLVATVCIVPLLVFFMLTHIFAVSIHQIYAFSPFGAYYVVFNTAAENNYWIISPALSAALIILFYVHTGRKPTVQRRAAPRPHPVKAIIEENKEMKEPDKEDGTEATP